ncbi:hypothetical protein CI238_12160 [Colletotrichum incanum]|uniref:Uncharacterized protein n=1 Tax=Colletotrichum incanum TaxID=1573173 RepID=A0A161YF23_COLIC|nr:hypothetical protein CI238_12160 [Colletotrichum incanum]
MIQSWSHRLYRAEIRRARTLAAIRIPGMLVARARDIDRVLEGATSSQLPCDLVQPAGSFVAA